MALGGATGAGPATAQPVVPPCEPVLNHATAEVSDLARFNLGPAPGREGCGLAELVGAWSPFGLGVMRSGHLDQELRLVVDLPPLESGAEPPGGARPSADGAPPPPDAPRYVAWVATPDLDRIEALGTVTPGVPFAVPVHWNKIIIVVSREEGAPAADAPRWRGPVVLLGRWRESGWRPWSSRRDRALARQALDRLGIGHLRDRSIRALSGGQQQRVFIARALIGDPDIVLLDEPTTGVDIKTRHDVMHLLGELHRGGLTIVLTTHDLNAVASHLPRLVCMGEGRVVADGTPPEVLTPDVLRDVYGAEMVVLRRGRTVYVVAHDDAPLDAVAAEEQHESFHAEPASASGPASRG